MVSGIVGPLSVNFGRPAVRCRDRASRHSEVTDSISKTVLAAAGLSVDAFDAALPSGVGSLPEASDGLVLLWPNTAAPAA